MATQTSLQLLDRSPRKMLGDLVDLFDENYDGEWYLVDAGEACLYVCAEGTLSLFVRKGNTFSFCTMTCEQEKAYAALLAAKKAPKREVRCVSGRHTFQVAANSPLGQSAQETEGVLIIPERQCEKCEEALRRRAFREANDSRHVSHRAYRLTIGMAASL